MSANFADLLPSDIVHECRNAAGHSTIAHQRECVGRLETAAGTKDVFVHKKHGRLIIEFQPVSVEAEVGVKILDRVQRIHERVAKAETVSALLEAAVDELRLLSGFDRVNAYRFLSDDAGEVVAESRLEGVDSFLGLRFPAFDVPQAARLLYSTTPIRIIPSVAAEQVVVAKTGSEEEPLDLSLAIFRGVVPVHVLYLQNMGVKATLSLPIIIDNNMWGLFAFHHMDEYMLSSEVLSALEILGGSISMMLNAIQQQQRLARLQECTRLVNTLFVPDDSSLGFTAYWDTASKELATLISCDGVGLLSEGRFDVYGLCPPVSMVRDLASLLNSDNQLSKTAEEPTAFDSVAEKYPTLDFGDTAGVLAIPTPALSYSYLFFFRRSAGQAVRWAGSPEKDITQEDDGFRLNPRASFAEYQSSNQ